MNDRLRRLLLELRAMLASEVPVKLHRLTPLPDGGESFGHEIGMPFTVQFSRYIGHADHWGETRPGMSSILEISEWCHGKHTSHQLAGQQRSLCAQLVYEVAYLGKEVAEVSYSHALPETQALGMLTSALQHAVEWRARPVRLTVDFDGPDPVRYQRIVKTTAA